MFGFSRKKRGKTETSKTDGALLRSLDGREVRYVNCRDRATCQERVVGKNGRINVTDTELIICCEGGIVFRADKNTLCAWELMSLSGVTLEKPEDPGVVYIAYYTYHRK